MILAQSLAQSSEVKAFLRSRRRGFILSCARPPQTSTDPPWEERPGLLIKMPQSQRPHYSQVPPESLSVIISPHHCPLSRLSQGVATAQTGGCMPDTALGSDLSITWETAQQQGKLRCLCTHLCTWLFLCHSVCVPQTWGSWNFPSVEGTLGTGRSSVSWDKPSQAV